MVTAFQTWPLPTAATNTVSILLGGTVTSAQLNNVPIIGKRHP